MKNKNTDDYYAIQFSIKYRQIISTLKNASHK